MRGRLFSARGLAVVGVSLVSLIGCCLLAWWQWDRFESSSGTLQNLGYVLQWPLFGLFPAFMFWRIRRMDAAGEPAAEPATEPAGEPDTPAESQHAEPVPAVRSRVAYVQNTTIDHDDQDPELAAYNAYLAKLNAQEDRHAR